MLTKKLFRALMIVIETAAHSLHSAAKLVAYFICFATVYNDGPAVMFSAKIIVKR